MSIPDWLGRVFTGYFVKNLPMAREFNPPNDRFSLESLDFFNKIILANQAKLINYNFAAHTKHYNLGHVLLKPPHRHQLEQKLKLVRPKLEDLEGFIHEELEILCKKNFDFAHEYFSNRHLGDKTRICLKCFFKGKIETIFRRKIYHYSSQYKGFAIDSNTAFQQICRGERYFLSNDIPKDIFRKEYKNSRIDEQLAKEYYQKYHTGIGRLRPKNHSANREWKKVWKYSEEKIGKDSYDNEYTCYKSTLVIPLILLKDETSAQIIRYCKHDVHSRGIILGFLCFDHKEEGFFQERKDVAIGEVIADILSLYLFINMAFTKWSPVFQKSKSLLRRENI